MNESLLRKVQKHILKEPRRLDMSFWIDRMRGRHNPPPCGTAACIAGWAVLLSGKGEDEGQSTMSQAMGLLSLDSADAGRLFFDERWPDHFSMVLAECEPGSTEAAEVTVERIDHFIATNGRK